jgi:cyclopropane fatty-acyl-phospholipid synthase-like methyltransferase
MRKYWKDSNNSTFRIDQEVVVSYFNKTQSLVFDDESARKEESAILPFLSITKQSRVLDLGCADGRWARLLVPKCKEYVGTDIAHSFIKKAKKEFDGENARFYCLPAQDYLVDEAYELILIIGLITYMNDDEVEKMARNCKRMLAEGGNVILRSVTIKDNRRRMVYDRKPNFIKRIFGERRYQIIRRNMNEELELFNMFRLVHHQNITGTGYTFYIFA